MSYARFGADGSEVYVFMNCGGSLECCGCWLDDQWTYGSTDAMIEHLKKHEEAGHHVPSYVYDELRMDDKENFGGS